MRIELELFNAIIHSPLFPSGYNMLGGYDEVKHHLGKTPNNIDEAKEWIRKAVGNKVTFTYAIIPQALPSSVFVNPQKSEYIADKYPLRFPILSLEGNTYKRTYKSIIDWECYRIHNTLLQFAAGINQDVRLKATIKGTLQNLYALMGQLWTFYEYGEGPEPRCSDPNAHQEENAQTIKQCNEILFYLLNRMVCLYYEIVVAFKEFCTDYEPMVSTIEWLKGYLKGRESINQEYESLLEAHSIQQGIIKNSREVVNSGLESIKQWLNHTDDTTRTIITEAEDFIFNTNDSVSSISKDKIKSDIHSMNNAREIVSYIDGIMDLFQTNHIEPISPKSIPAQLINYLTEQKTIYITKIDSSFIPHLEQIIPTAKNITPKLGPKDKKRIQSESQKIIGHFAGYNLKSEKIMSDSDFARLTGYINEAIELENVPVEIVPITHINLTQAHIRHTIYKINNLMYKRGGRTFWLDFILLTFTKFKNTNRETLYRNWNSGDSYEADVREMLKINKSLK